MVINMTSKNLVITDSFGVSSSPFSYRGAWVQRDALIKRFTAYCEGKQLFALVGAYEAAFGQKKIGKVDLLTGGRGTSKIIKIEVEGHDVVCRITDHNRPHFFIDCASEIERMSIADKLFLTPKVHYANQKTGIIMMDYISNIPLMTYLLTNKGESNRLYLKLAEKLQTLHEGPKFSECTNIFTDVMQTALATKPTCMPLVARRILGIIAAVERTLLPYQNQESVPSHKELNSNNVLFDGREIYFIDWESSANTDRFVDLAIVSNFFIFNSSQERLFLERYFSAPSTVEQRAQLLLMKVVCLAFYGFKALRRVTGPGKQDLSKEVVDFDKLPSYHDLLCEFFNSCTKSFSFDELKVMAYGYFKESVKYIESTEFQEAMTVLTKKIPSKL